MVSRAVLDYWSLFLRVVSLNYQKERKNDFAGWTYEDEAKFLWAELEALRDNRPVRTEIS